MRSRRGSLVAVLTLVAAAAGCSADEAAQAPGAAPATTAAPVSGSPGVSGPPRASGLPGDEALTPPPPDPAGPELVARAAQLPVGALAGSVELVVSGLVAFDEEVRGRCAETAAGRVFALVLSDGSQLELALGPDGGTSRLTAPGIDVAQTLEDVDLRVDTGFTLSAGLLTDGTTESSGRVLLAGSCS